MGWATRVKPCSHHYRLRQVQQQHSGPDQKIVDSEVAPTNERSLFSYNDTIYYTYPKLKMIHNLNKMPKKLLLLFGLLIKLY